MNNSNPQVVWLRLSCLALLFLVLVVLPQDLSAQCQGTYDDASYSANTEMVDVSTSVYDMWAFGSGGECDPGIGGYTHYYQASVQLSSPEGEETATGEQETEQYGGGSWAEAWAVLSALNRPGIYNFSRISTIYCTIGGTILWDQGGGSVTVPQPFTLAVKEVSFTNDIAILKDQSESESAPPIDDPVWSATKNDPVAYVSGNTMRVTVKFDVINPPANPVSGRTIEGVIENLGAFKKTGVTIPSSGTVSITNVDLDTALPSEVTQFYDPMTIVWRHMQDGGSCPSCTPDGSTQHKVYVTYATPISSPVVLTSLHLAVSQAGATTQQQVVDKTWDQFKSNAVQTWYMAPLLYYGDDSSNTAICDPGDDGIPLLIRQNRAGQCTCFTELLLSALRVNGIGTTGTVSAVRQKALPVGAQAMLVFNWNYDVTGSNPSPFEWSMNFPSTPPEMQPEPPGGDYGEVTNANGKPGQNMPTPKEKVFGVHFFVRTTGISGDRYFDPSYGVRYANQSDFENDAIKGWAIQDGMDPPNRLRVRETGSGSSIGFCGVSGFNPPECQTP